MRSASLLILFALFGIVPTQAAQLLSNPGFEATPFTSDWQVVPEVTDPGGLDGSDGAARLGWPSSASLSQSVSPTLSDFTCELLFRIAGANEAQAFRIELLGGGGAAIELRTGAGGSIEVLTDSGYLPLKAESDGSTFDVPANETVRLRIVGRNVGTAQAAFDLAWSQPGSTDLVFAAPDLSPPGGATSDPVDTVRFQRNLSNGNSFIVDNVSLTDEAATVAASTHALSEPPSPPDPPPSAEVVNIAGVYPHLAMTNSELESGIGAVVPWAGKLWAITYAPHKANGSDDKLYEIAPDLSRVIRPESIGGTPANRFIHQASNQLIIGPYFIDANGGVRTLPYGVAPGRHTGTAAHLSDPDRVYIFTMENGLYDVDANDLSVVTRYPDRQGTGDRFLFGYHGKGTYTGQGRLVVANNGRPNRQNDPTGPAGVLASWDGTTVADNGGDYRADRDLNQQSEENGRNPAAPQPEFVAGWDQISKVQHCEVTGPGGIYGNPNPATDPIWATGFDAKSVVLRVLEDGTWHTWRLPKGSYSHDGSHGWHTEWPRIRQLNPDDPASPHLMHMHGLFFDFPKDFSSTDFGGLEPICSYYKMPVDYCEFDGRLVIAKNDTSKFSNALVRQAQSNLWFGQIEDLRDWGAPGGHGAVWMNEPVGTGETSAPFLINGFSQGTLHLRNRDASGDLNVRVETSSGDGNWGLWKEIAVPAQSYRFELLNEVPGRWLRLRTTAPSSDFTAFFHLANPFPHESIASRATDRYAALANIEDVDGYSDGIVRVMSGQDLRLEFASDSGYHRIGQDMVLRDIDDANRESNLRSEVALSQGFGFDAASAWLNEGSVRFRLPKLHANYESPNLSGWPRAVREVVTERELLNCHGTFYEVPRGNSGGARKMRAMATHGKRITDMASWRGLWVLTGVLDDAPESNSLVKTADGQAALWLGEIDELWKMGEPRGIGGPWKDTPVSAESPSDPYLMYGFDRKELRLSHDAPEPVTFTVEVDFLADGEWSVYQSFEVAPGENFTHLFPSGFHAHWVRLSSDTGTTATAQFIYGPAGERDRLLDWARENDLPTGGGRSAFVDSDADADTTGDLLEYLFGTNPKVPDTVSFAADAREVKVVMRDLPAEAAIEVEPQISENLSDWRSADDRWFVAPNQSSVSDGFTRMRFAFPQDQTKVFFRLRFSVLGDPSSI